MNVIRLFYPLIQIFLNMISMFITIMLFPVLGLWVVYILFLNPKCLDYLNVNPNFEEGDEHN